MDWESATAVAAQSGVRVVLPRTGLVMSTSGGMLGRIRPLFSFGLGARLVDECIRFAKGKGYRSMMLWTNAGLDAARHIYEARGFVLQKEERHRSFGKNLVGQFWTLKL